LEAGTEITPDMKNDILSHARNMKAGCDRIIEEHCALSPISVKGPVLIFNPKDNFSGKLRNQAEIDVSMDYYFKENERKGMLPKGTTLSDIDTNSEEFKILEKEVKACLNGQIPVFTQERILRGQKPITFRLVVAVEVRNIVLELKVSDYYKSLQEQKKSGSVLKLHYGYHLVSGDQMKEIATNGVMYLQPIDKRAKNIPSYGVIVGKNPDYVISKTEGIENSIGGVTFLLMLKVLPGRKATNPPPANNRPQDADFYSQDNDKQWHLFSEDQCCPAYFIGLGMEENTQTKSDDL